MGQYGIGQRGRHFQYHDTGWKRCIEDVYKRQAGHHVIGDVHLGDWGLQMGLIITELHERKPELCYFDENYDGAYPEEAPFTIAELEEIYPTASKRSKEDEPYKEAAMQATYELQHGRKGYQALLQHILNVSVTDLKRNYANLNVSFDLWKGEMCIRDRGCWKDSMRMKN